MAFANGAGLSWRIWLGSCCHAHSRPAEQPTSSNSPLPGPPALGSYTLSASELSSDDMPSASGRHVHSRGTQSPPALIPYVATVPRLHRSSPIAPHTTRGASKGAHTREEN